MGKEMVIHPEHYNLNGRKECWDEMIEVFGKDAVVIFDCLCAYKYMYRLGSKDGNPEEEDKKKANNYVLHAKRLLCSGAGSKFSKAVYEKTLETIMQQLMEPSECK